MARDYHYVGLDVGSANIRAVIAKLDHNTGQPNIIGVGEAPASGIRRGVIIDLEDAVSSISEALDKAERMTGIEVDRATISINGPHVNNVVSHGVIAVSRADGEITEHDVDRVIEASQTVQLPMNREILHVVPQHFAVDGQSGIKDPAGMSGIRLEVESTIIQVSSPFLRNLQKCLKQAGISADDLVLSSLAAANSSLTKRHKEIGSVLVDLGAGTTGIIVYEEGQLLLASVVPIGQGHVTNDLAIGLRTTVDTAEKIKLKYGHTSPEFVKKDTEIQLSDFDPNEDSVVSQRHVVEIIEARIDEILSEVNKELKKINRDGQLPGGVILTGGGASLPGIAEYAKDKLRLSVTIGSPDINITSIVDKISVPSYATSVGLIQWAVEQDTHGGSPFDWGWTSSFLDNALIKKISQWIKNFLP